MQQQRNSSVASTTIESNPVKFSSRHILPNSITSPTLPKINTNILLIIGYTNTLGKNNKVSITVTSVTAKDIPSKSLFIKKSPDKKYPPLSKPTS
ncbi:hypothetical protein [Pediococcus acidilactici]|jgi:hypothetical protein|uniref:hypothetical protein n=1 Tax=Pediococcus acidilactici TaxID=1254 RepID=UPI0012DB2068|nr:hypothetical protein [Pediococcus acidilactici]